MRIYLIIVFFFIMTGTFLAQNNTGKTSSHEPDKAKNEDSLGERIFTVGLDYGSNQAYKGRNSGEKQPYYSPNFNYQAKSGFFFYLSFTNLINSKSDTSIEAVQARNYSIDQWQITPGYNFNIDKKTTSSINVTHFFTKDTMLVNAGIKNNINYYMDHKFKIINEKLSFDLDFGNETDFGVTLESYHSFDIENPFTKDNDELSFIPGFSFTAGTQNFYSKVAARRIGKPLSTSKTTFSIISFDMAIPISYTIGGMTFEAAYNYTAAFNQPSGSKTKPFGYATLSLSYDF